MANELFVSIAGMRISDDPSSVLVTYGLSSCIGVSIYDPVVKVGGLLHFMLPASGKQHKPKNPYMYADAGLPLFFKEAYKCGADKKRIITKIAGGAQITDVCRSFEIGKRNRMAVHKILRENGIRVCKEDTGGNAPRTMSLEIATGRVCLQILGSNLREL